MNLFLLLPALILLVLAVTRAARLDWKRSIICLLIAGALFYTNHRQMVSMAKARAKAYSARKRQEQSLQEREQNEEGHKTSNNQIQNIGTNAPNSDL
jgi:hypothetical protein